ncbi:MAG TPA: CAP domain-containing protein [Isosphaeraceae bacterium]|nr:CAP domain-containing protein [Isosphaeraceae bacterium]
MTTPFAAIALVLAGLIPQASDDTVAADLIAAHNKERAERKLPPLVAEPRLTAAAKAHAADMAAHKKMTHDGSDGSTLIDRVKREKYTYLNVGENVAEGQSSVASVMDSWMNSPHHRENILGDFTEVGVARAEADDGTPYWCVDFGRPFPRLDPDKAEEELAERLNHARADASTTPLHVSPKLARAARAIAVDYAAKGPAKPGDSAKDEKKDGPKTPDPVERIKQSGYRYMRITETGTYGTPTPEETLKALFANSEQKATLLGKDYSDLGIGYALAPDGRPAWVVILAKPLR